MRWLVAQTERHFRLVLLVSCAAILALAWFNRFITDDGYIVFRYANHLVHGQGLVYNPGEHVEGYTCFLFVILVAAGMKAGLDPIVASEIIGILAAAGTLFATYTLVRRLTDRRLLALAALLLLGTNYSFSAWSTGGLETQLHACLVTAFLSLALAMLLDGTVATARLVACSLLAALALMTRPDTVILLGPTSVALLVHLFVVRRSTGGRAVGVLALILPFGVLVGIWLAWKLSYYGTILPNTFVAKATFGEHLGRGLRYVYRFVSEYWLGAVLIFPLWLWRDVLRPRFVAILLVGTLALWTGYLAFVGGDFMEFRMFVPVLPIFAWLLACTTRELQTRGGLGLAFASVVMAANVQHALMYSRVGHPDMIQHAHALDPRMDHAMENWVEVGQTLKSGFDPAKPPTIAMFAAGVVPYYSDLPTIDLVGLNDRWVAAHGDRFSPAAGHERLATMDYLLTRHVNLLINNPRVESMPVPEIVDVDTRHMPRFVAGEATGLKLPAGTRMLEIPVVRNRALLALYITPSPEVDRAIAAHGWRVHDIRVFTTPD